MTSVFFIFVASYLDKVLFASPILIFLTISSNVDVLTCAACSRYSNLVFLVPLIDILYFQHTF